ncbi:bifunctional nuclease family protein [Brevibacterium sp. 50QC2O2]|uniref:bifunctional nuclease family protein n=1 Tax=Brevibacterium TaxID=1696 RepID=UPI00211CDBC3|nr:MULTISPECIES: bifunctional nuclease family protein [unclassified Brevibacterium]MCQ9384189.1 bifunctional nuclease family protein [Brevibacterium sp. 68QC2CO]MCQ9388333.1 bifunctional nuclease family protein [Brevibacterium sp. 50QC2O2]
MSDIQLEVVGVRVEMPANQPILLLKAAHAPRFLPIWIGTAEAQAVSIVLRGLEPPRPLSHNLMLEIFRAYDDAPERVVITAQEQHVFHAAIHTSMGKVLDARPSDAVPLALLAQCPVYTTGDLLDSAGIDAPQPDEEEVAQFRDFLDHVSPEDFENGDG